MDCSHCGTQLCQKRGRDNLPENCPMLDEGRIERDAAAYHTEENQCFYADSLQSMRQSFGKMPRVIEAVNFCRMRGYRKIGVAYCSGFIRFGSVIAEIFQKAGFEVYAVGCKLGGFSPEELVDNCPPPPALPAEGRSLRAICNPIGQAMYMNEVGTEFNVVAGLCVGHDSLFFKNSNAPCTVVALKDRLFPDQCAPSIQKASEWEFDTNL